MVAILIGYIIALYIVKQKEEIIMLINSTENFIQSEGEAVERGGEERMGGGLTWTSSQSNPQSGRHVVEATAVDGLAAVLRRCQLRRRCD